MLKKPAIHRLVLRCGECDKRFQIRANPVDDKYTCPHCGGIVEYECYRTGPLEAKPIGPTENK